MKNKKIEININNKLNFIFEGELKNNKIESLDTKKTIYNYLEKLNRKDNIVEIIKSLRTILKDYEELRLEFSLITDDYNTKVIYENQELILFEEENKYELSTKYEIGKGISFKLEQENPEFVVDIVSNLMKKIHNLRNIKIIELDHDDKLICEIYKVFYQENPNFSNKNTFIKIEAMLIILEKFDIVLNKNYNFQLLGKDKKPMSIDLREKLKKLRILGEINPKEKILNKESKSTIEIIGNYLREYLNNKEDYIKSLIDISKIIYTKDYCLYKNASIKDISEFTNNNEENVEECLILIRKIGNETNLSI